MGTKDNHEQFLRLLMQNDKSIYAYILSVVSNVSDADDIMQETSAVLWRKFSEYNPELDFVPWALTVARYQVLNFLKKRKRSKVVFSEDLMASIKDEVEKKLPEMNDRLCALKGCIKRLDGNDQAILKLRYDKGLTLENVGAKISKSTRAAFYSLSRIHKLLMVCVEKKLKGLLADG